MSSNHVKDFHMMCDVLQRLLRRSNSLWNAGRDLADLMLTKKTMDNYRELIEVKPPISSVELEREANESSRRDRLSLCLDKPLYMPPLGEKLDFIPLLFLKADLSKPSYDVSLRIEMFRYERNDGKKNCKLLDFVSKSMRNHQNMTMPMSKS
jgi:hypothetical protein